MHADLLASRVHHREVFVERRRRPLFTTDGVILGGRSCNGKAPREAFQKAQIMFTQARTHSWLNVNSVNTFFS